MSKPIIIWEGFPGAQKDFLSCPVWECLLHGNRGGGKTDVLLMDYLQGVGVGYGADYRGLLLREATTELGDIIAKGQKWIPQMFPGAKYNKSRKVWTFLDGETLWFNYARTEDDYWQYHGHEYPWIGWEEITNHPFDHVYRKIMSCNRSSNKDIPRKYRATCNPSGPGHMWVKERFINKSKAGKVYYDEHGQGRTHLKSELAENRKLLEADPMYLAKLLSMTEDDKMLRAAWVEGSWDLIMGGFFTDVWDKKIHILPTFSPPKSWQLRRGFDWGSSKPWAVTYGFETNGEQPLEYGVNSEIPYIPKDSLIVPAEIYGWNGTVNEGDGALSQDIAQRVKNLDNALFREYGIRCYPGPADTSIWEVRDGKSIAGELSGHGCRWTKAYKGSGSRIAGWSLLRSMLGAAKRKDVESPHLYFFEQAKHHTRTLPIMQRDKLKPEDIDTELEDHCFTFSTEIITNEGIKQIGKLVDKSGKVLTVNGEFVDFSNCRLIKKDAKIIKVTFSDGFSVECTEDHKFLTTKGFVDAINLLTLPDTLCIVGKKYKEKLWKESPFYQKKNKDSGEKIITCVGNIIKEKAQGCTELFGSSLMAKLKKDTIRIIRKKILPKTKLKTLNFCYPVSICQTTPKAEVQPLLRTVLTRLQNGIEAKMENCGIMLIMKLQKKRYMQNIEECVKTVTHLLRLNGKMEMLSVATPVKHNGEKNQELMILKECVKYVPVHLLSTSIRKQKPVHVHAKMNYVMGVECIEYVSENKDVYCLEVKGTHTFAIGNGVLVSNCMDSLRYLAARKMTRLKRRKVNN